MTFKSLISDSKIIKAIDELGYVNPTPIQEKAIPKILEGQDILASADTGTGKTGAFLLPALCRLATPSNRPPKGPRILILVPTRELAMQVAAESIKYSKYLAKTKTVCIYGGAPYPPQNRDLAKPYEILVATPGRLIDHMEQRRVDFSRLELLVLDEADRMLDMGFIQPVEQIVAKTPKNRQTLLFSATLKGNVMTLSKRLLTNPVEISVARETPKHENIEERLYHVDNIDHKNRLLDHFLAEPSFKQTIIFTATKRQAEHLANLLHEKGHAAASLHGDMNQRQRTKTMTRLRQGSVTVLVATDVAARGIDVQNITHVINFDLPTNVEDYVHRIGRTGRAGASGMALSFAARKDFGFVKEIEKFTVNKMTVHTVEGLEPSAKPSNEPKKKSKRPPFRPKFQKFKPKKRAMTTV